MPEHTATPPPAAGRKPIPSPALAALALLGWLALTFCAPALGAAAGMPGDWYSTLDKPSWNPPSWLFGPVWTTLYTMMAVAAWLVSLRGGWRTQSRPLALYLIQLALNAAWTPLFFRLRNPGLAMLDILLLLAAIAATAAAFARVRRTAAALLVPYLLWVAFATVLNATLWWMNRIKERDIPLVENLLAPGA